jgi:hypothetical protein
MKAQGLYAAPSHLVCIIRTGRRAAQVIQDYLYGHQVIMCPSLAQLITKRTMALLVAAPRGGRGSIDMTRSRDTP